jgi:hypothetical protein
MRSQFCISSTASFEKINKAVTNRSGTKQTFSFSKSNRFEDPKPTLIHINSDAQITHMEETSSKESLRPPASATEQDPILLNVTLSRQHQQSTI